MAPRRCCACISAPGSFMFLNGKLHLMSISFGVISNQYFVGSPFQLHQDMDKLYQPVCSAKSNTSLSHLQQYQSGSSHIFYTNSQSKDAKRSLRRRQMSAVNSSLPKAAGFSHCSSLPVPCSLLTSPQTSTLHVTIG